MKILILIQNVENPPVLVLSHSLSSYSQSDPYCLYKDGHINSVAMVYFITDISLERILQDFKIRFSYIGFTSVL